MTQVEGIDMTAANTLAAFLVFPELIAEGKISRPAADFTERDDFAVLYEHVDQLDNDDNFLEYVREAGAEEAKNIAEAGRTFFNALINDKQAIPMDAAEKAKLVKLLRETYAGSKLN